MEEEQRAIEIKRRGFWDGQTVRARRSILDSPLTDYDGSARRGDVGAIQEIADGWLFVDFGRGAILCHPDEIE